jgi:hypothetical protein
VEHAPPVLLDPLQGLLLADHRAGRAAWRRARAQPTPRGCPHQPSYQPSPEEALPPRD